MTKQWGRSYCLSLSVETAVVRGPLSVLVACEGEATLTYQKINQKNILMASRYEVNISYVSQIPHGLKWSWLVTSFLHKKKTINFGYKSGRGIEFSDYTFKPF